MSELKRFAVAWNIMWGFSYIIVAAVAPWIVDGDILTNISLYIGLGLAILIGVILRLSTKHQLLGRIILSFTALIEIYGGITSWTGITPWNVPFPNPEIFQVSMAFADLISAVFMLTLALPINTKNN